jgi:hypothetical protein
MGSGQEVRFRHADHAKLQIIDILRLLLDREFRERTARGVRRQIQKLLNIARD